MAGCASCCLGVAFLLATVAAHGPGGQLRSRSDGHFLSLRYQDVPSAAGLHDNSTGMDLLQELEQISGREHRVAVETRMIRLQEALRPMFAAMPKDAGGHVGPTGARYLLHRLFVQRHGWHVSGLSLHSGDTYDSSSPSDILKTHSEEHYRLFDDKLSSHGFSLHQVAAFAATLETIVHAENVKRMEMAARLRGLSLSENSLSEEQAALVYKAYILFFISGIENDLEINVPLTSAEFDELEGLVEESYNTFPDTMQFTWETRARVLADVPLSERNSRDNMMKVVSEIGERYGRFQDTSCHHLKDILTPMAKPGTGRVHLGKFYSGSLGKNTTSPFRENVPYLRQLGALDESDPKEMTVVIPNYLNAPNNCIMSSKFYSICCIDECESLLGVLENAIGAPSAMPSVIADLVTELHSDTVPAPHALSASLMQRLQQIAAHHGGSVPLHGRLFAQWMHHVYPNECMYPHVAGTIKPAPDGFDLHEEGFADESVMKMIADASVSADHATNAGDHQDLPWSDQEETFVGVAAPVPRTSTMGGTRMALLTVPLAAVVLAFRSYMKQGLTDTSAKLKHSV